MMNYLNQKTAIAKFAVESVANSADEMEVQNAQTLIAISLMKERANEVHELIDNCVLSPI